MPRDTRWKMRRSDILRRAVASHDIGAAVDPVKLDPVTLSMAKARGYVTRENARGEYANQLTRAGSLIVKLSEARKRRNIAVADYKKAHVVSKVNAAVADVHSADELANSLQPDLAVEKSDWIKQHRANVRDRDALIAQVVDAGGSTCARHPIFTAPAAVTWDEWVRTEFASDGCGGTLNAQALHVLNHLRLGITFRYIDDGDVFESLDTDTIKFRSPGAWKLYSAGLAQANLHERRTGDDGNVEVTIYMCLTEAGHAIRQSAAMQRTPELRSPRGEASIEKV